MKKLLFAFITLLVSGSLLAAVNLNTASQAELESLKGIGPAKAQAIIEYRKKMGAFKTVDELEKVEGIGPATVNAIKKDIIVTATGKPAEPAAVKPAAKSKP